VKRLERDRAWLGVVASCALLTACGPSGETSDAGGPDAASEERRDAGTDAPERPDAAAAELVLSPARLEFEQAAPGCVRSEELSLSNEGSADSGPLSFAIGGPGASQFAIASHTCPSLPAGGRCTISVEFRPTGVGWSEASIEVEAAGRLASAELAGDSASDGCGWPPVASPRWLDFGSVVVGTTSAPQTITVRNHGGSAFEPLRVELTGPSAASFSLTRDICSGVPLAGGFDCEIEVVMSPSSPGALSASLDVSAGAAMTSVSLTGAGVTGTSPTCDPSIADFGTWDVGASSPTITFTLRNPSPSPTGVLSITVAGANPGDFVIDTPMSTCDGVPLPVFGSCVVLVSFAPVSSGPRSASLRFSATPGGTATAALSGTAR